MMQFLTRATQKIPLFWEFFPTKTNFTSFEAILYCNASESKRN